MTTLKALIGLAVCSVVAGSANAYQYGNQYGGGATFQYQPQYRPYQPSYNPPRAQAPRSPPFDISRQEMSHFRDFVGDVRGGDNPYWAGAKWLVKPNTAHSD